MNTNRGDPDSPDSAPGEPPTSLVVPVLASEGVLVLLALGLGTWTGTDWQPMVRGTAADVLIGVLGGLGFVPLHLMLLFPGGQRNPLFRTVYRPLHTALHPVLQGARLDEIALLALASGVGEELFFRGWLQNEVGIVGASLLFGAAHVWTREALPYGLYAASMGFVLGGLFAYTEQGLWAPTLAHIVNNLLGLLALAYDWLPEPPS